MSNDSIEVLQAHDEEQSTYVLVTGANSGLGFGICKRLIDNFIRTRPDYQSIILIPTTRDKQKSDETVRRLTRHIRKHGYSRAHIHPELLDLTSLRSVQDLADRLQESIPHLDVIFWNAGLGGLVGVYWPSVFWDVCTDFFNAMTTPKFKIGARGLVTAPQLSSSSSSSARTAESVTKDDPSVPPLGKVFASNVFGHYVLSHLLVPLLTQAPDAGRIVSISSIEAYASSLDLDDIQGLKTQTSYESSKRLTDILALTFSMPSTAPFVAGFLSPSPATAAGTSDLSKRKRSSLATTTSQSPNRKRESQPRITLSDNSNPFTSTTYTKPTMYLAHPGICATNFVPLPSIIQSLFVLAVLLARWLGSFWHTVWPYSGANAPVWLALAPKDEIADKEVEGGKGKWGSACTRLGKEHIERTEVEGWGTGGERGGEERAKFEDLGRACWKEIESLREEWQERMSG